MTARRWRAQGAAVLNQELGAKHIVFLNLPQRFITVKVEPTSHSQKLHHDDSWEMIVPTIYEKEGIFYLVTAFEKKSNIIKFADYYHSKESEVMSVDLNFTARISHPGKAAFEIIVMAKESPILTMTD